MTVAGVLSYDQIQTGLRVHALAKLRPVPWTTPTVAFRSQPVTYAAIGILSLWMTWFGVVLLVEPFTPGRVHAFRGPLTILGIHTWGILFLLAAAITASRFLLYGHRILDLTAHLVGSMLVVAWAAGWFAGPLTTAQPAYSLIALLAVLLPYIGPLARRFLFLVPKRSD